MGEGKLEGLIDRKWSRILRGNGQFLLQENGEGEVRDLAGHSGVDQDA